MPAAPAHCTYVKHSYGYVSGCGYRAAYNKFWKWCPYCGKTIVNISREASDKESKWDLEENKKKRRR